MPSPYQTVPKHTISYLTITPQKNKYTVPHQNYTQGHKTLLYRFIALKHVTQLCFTSLCHYVKVQHVTKPSQYLTSLHPNITAKYLAEQSRHCTTLNLTLPTPQIKTLRLTITFNLAQLFPHDHNHCYATVKKPCIERSQATHGLVFQI